MFNERSTHSVSSVMAIPLGDHNYRSRPEQSKTAVLVKAEQWKDCTLQMGFAVAYPCSLFCSPLAAHFNYVNVSTGRAICHPNSSCQGSYHL